MFDDPKKELKSLEQQLLADEEAPESAMLDEAEFEALYNEILEEFGPRKEEPQAIPKPQEPQIRNFANGYGRNIPPVPTAAPAVTEEKPPVTEMPGPKGNGGLILTICLESIAIAAVLGLWILSLLGGI